MLTKKQILMIHLAIIDTPVKRFEKHVDKYNSNYWPV